MPPLRPVQKPLSLWIGYSRIIKEKLSGLSGSISWKTIVEESYTLGNCILGNYIQIIKLYTNKTNRFFNYI